MKEIKFILEGCGDPKFYKILEEIGILHDNKNKDYATSEDPLQNFRRVAMWCRKYNLITKGNELVKVALIYFLKQLDAVLKLLKENQRGMVEGVPQRLNDMVAYSIIARILYEEDNK